MFCPKCGTKNEDGAAFCGSCGSALGTQAAPAQNPAPVSASIESHESANGGQVTTVNIQAPAAAKNGLGTAGFVLALLGIFLCWVPVLGWILWILGALLSIIGVFKKPKGLAIAGVIISFIDVIILLLVIGGCAAAGGTMMMLGGF